MDYNGYKPIHIIIHDNPSIILVLYHIHDILIIVVDLKPWFWCHVHCLLLIFRCMLSYIPSYQGQISHDLVGSMILMPRKRISQIYHLVMTNSLPWKIPMLLRTVNHLFLSIPWRTVSHNQRVQETPNIFHGNKPWFPAKIFPLANPMNHGSWTSGAGRTTPLCGAAWQVGLAEARRLKRNPSP